VEQVVLGELRAVSTSIMAPREREVLMTGMDRAERRTNEAALERSASEMLVGLSFLGAPPATAREEPARRL